MNQAKKHFKAFSKLADDVAADITGLKERVISESTDKKGTAALLKRVDDLVKSNDLAGIYSIADELKASIK